MGDRQNNPVRIAYVLAGGVSSRFGENKAFAKLGGITMLERMADLLTKVTGEAFVVGGSEEQYRGFDVEFIADRWPREGPLGGIVTALDVSAKSPAKAKWNLVVSCDMPFLTRDWLAYLCERAAASEAEVILPRSDHGLEPLCACWRTAVLPALEAAFGAGVRKVTEGTARLKREVLDETEWKRFDTNGRLFWNMNTIADYEEARRLIEGGASPSPTVGSAR
jgi:molybdopterin-guanine dinucleotide biosynthesis protein A